MFLRRYLETGNEHVIGSGLCGCLVVARMFSKFVCRQDDKCKLVTRRVTRLWQNDLFWLFLKRENGCFLFVCISLRCLELVLFHICLLVFDRCLAGCLSPRRRSCRVGTLSWARCTRSRAARPRHTAPDPPCSMASQRGRLQVISLYPCYRHLHDYFYCYLFVDLFACSGGDGDQQRGRDAVHERAAGKAARIHERDAGKKRLHNNARCFFVVLLLLLLLLLLLMLLFNMC
jgi:hypothetical protein